jgi:zinc finger HIT domain-containing protein 3
LKDATPLRPLTSLKWPFIPEEPSFQDHLTSNDPKPLKINHYEAIGGYGLLLYFPSSFTCCVITLTASSPSIRNILNKEDDQLRNLLRQLDALRGREREEALEFLLGVAHPTKKKGIPKAILESADHDSLESFQRFSEAVHSAIEKTGSANTGLSWDIQTKD